jgi:hypothetical protein
MTEVLAPDIYRAHWENPLGKPTGKTHWENPLGKPTGKTHWENPLGKRRLIED